MNKGYFWDGLRVLNAKLSQTALVGPHEIAFNITNFCDSQCIFCIIHSKHTKISYATRSKRSNIPLEGFKKVVSEAAKMHVNRIQLSGSGDPLFHPDIFDMVKETISNGLNVVIFTNGINLEKKLGHEFDFSNRITLRISLHAASITTWKDIFEGNNGDDYVELLKYLKAIKQRTKNRIILHNVICGLNYKELPEMVKLAYELGAEEVSFQMVYDPGHVLNDYAWGKIKIDDRVLFRRILEQAIRISEDLGVKTNLSFILGSIGNSDELPAETLSRDSAVIYENIACYVGYFWCTITHDGELKTCCLRSMSYGNVFKLSLSEIWNSNNYKRFRFLADNKRFPEIEGCDITRCSQCRLNMKMHKVLHPFARTRYSFLSSLGSSI